MQKNSIIGILIVIISVLFAIIISGNNPFLPQTEDVTQTAEKQTEERNSTNDNQGNEALLTIEDILNERGDEILLNIRVKNEKEKILTSTPEAKDIFENFISTTFYTTNDYLALTLTEIDFSSTEQARKHFQNVYEEIEGLDEYPISIGDESVQISAQKGEIGSAIGFIKENVFIQLHVVGEQPIVNNSGLTTLARTVANKLTLRQRGIDNKNIPVACQDACGDETCQLITCLGDDCPCTETAQTCPQDCTASEQLIQENCVDQCGNGVCEEIVCQAIGCPCAETRTSCPADCNPEGYLYF